MVRNSSIFSCIPPEINLWDRKRTASSHGTTGCQHLPRTANHLQLNRWLSTKVISSDPYGPHSISLQFNISYFSFFLEPLRSLMHSHNIYSSSQCGAITMTQWPTSLGPTGEFGLLLPGLFFQGWIPTSEPSQRLNHPCSPLFWGKHWHVWLTFLNLN